MRAIKSILPLAALCLLISIPVLQKNDQTAPAYEKKAKTMEERLKTNEGRAEYFFNLMRDPATNSIPDNIRSLELKHAEDLPVATRAKSAMDPRTYTFTEVGPNDVGGRTRALAVDLDDPNIILAGGVSGGVWRSTNAGNSWTLVTDPSVINSVTFITQDPRAGFRDNWYFASGEFSGNSAGSRGGGGFYYGNGIFRSTDNGQTWSQIPTTDQSDNNSFNSPFDYISKIMVSPTTGSIFIASNGFGIYRSTDGLNFNLVLGGFGEHQWSDIDIDDNGDMIATLSEADSCGSCTQANSPGVYRSTNDGVSWTDVTPAGFANEFARSVISISPSTPNEVYVLIAETSGATIPKLYYIDLNNSGNNEERTGNLPNFGGQVGGFNLQGGYNMVVEVHPTDPNTVITGGTNLYVSFDGYTTAQPSNADDMWIGGYATANNVSQYVNHHPDQHVVAFDPTDPDKVWSGHDGGISLTNDINITPGTWIDKNNGYNVTQFYGVSLFRDVGDNRIMGGTQDNGTPYFNYDLVNGSTGSEDISSGDGSYSYFTSTFGYVSSQRGNVLRLTIQDDGSLSGCFFQGCPEQEWTGVEPTNAGAQLFIHPFEVDPFFTGTMYYPQSDSIWRNNNMGAIPLFQGSTTQGWSKISGASSGTGTTITALEATLNNPRSTLYFAGFDNNSTPSISKLSDATNNSNSQSINIPGAASGSYPHDITINPTDGNEVMVVFANYNVPSIFHSTDGGTTWTDVEGNLNGDIFTPGPSVRNAAIAQTPDGPVYFVGTSTGLYSTTDLNGAATVWTRQAEDLIGKTVVESLDMRPDDNVLAVASHGRGLFIGEPGISVSNEDEGDLSVPSEFALKQNYPNPFNPATNINFELPANSNVRLTVYNINGQKVAEVLSDQFFGAGSHSVNFDAGALASGVYIYRITARSLSGASDFSMSRKMTLIK